MRARMCLVVLLATSPTAFGSTNPSNDKLASAIRKAATAASLDNYAGVITFRKSMSRTRDTASAHVEDVGSQDWSIAVDAMGNVIAEISYPKGVRFRVGRTETAAWMTIGRDLLIREKGFTLDEASESEKIALESIDGSLAQVDHELRTILCGAAIIAEDDLKVVDRVADQPVVVVNSNGLANRLTFERTRGRYLVGAADYSEGDSTFHWSFADYQTVGSRDFPGTIRIVQKTKGGRESRSTAYTHVRFTPAEDNTEVATPNFALNDPVAANDDLPLFSVSRYGVGGISRRTLAGHGNE